MLTHGICSQCVESLSSIFNKKIEKVQKQAAKLVIRFSSRKHRKSCGNHSVVNSARPVIWVRDSGPLFRRATIMKNCFHCSHI